MLRGVPVVTFGRQWRRIQAQLPEDWKHARLALTPTNPKRLDQAAALLGPLTPGRSGEALRFESIRGGQGPSPGAVGRALARLDAERIRGTLELIGAQETVPAGHARPAAVVFSVPLVEAWEADRWGNLTFRESGRNFNPVIAMAAQLTIVQAQHLRELGEIDPDNVVTPGIFVDRVLHVPYGDPTGF